MLLKDELVSEVTTIFERNWEARKGREIPIDESLGLGNDAVNLEATVLYADLADSTSLVDQQPPKVAAEIYKTFLHCAAKIIAFEGGEVTAYDGDRVMAVYIGDQKNTSAVRTALKINYARWKIIGPALKAQYPTIDYAPKHVVGVDTSELFVARTGVRGANDLVWVGRAANYAAKLATLPDSFPTYITEEVFKRMLPATRHSTDGRLMWERVRWNTFDDRNIYRSNWTWRID